MIKSMTGYGRCKKSIDGKDITVEVHTVNSRFLDANIKMGRFYAPLEDKMKQYAQRYLSRGKLDLYVTVEKTSGDAVKLTLNREYVEAYLQQMSILQREYGVSGTVDLNLLASRPELLLSCRPDEDMEQAWTALEPVAAEAFRELVQMRLREGEKLKTDLLSRISLLEELKKKIAFRAPQAVSENNSRMKARIAELLDTVPVDEEKMLTECAVYADKADVTEELVRLGSHFSQLRTILDEDGAVGRKLDFLLQETNREVNTIGSKSDDTEISKLVIEAKCELEKIREQIQNIE